MDLTYKILWFEDTDSVIENLQPLIEDYLENLYFKLFIKVEKGITKDLFQTLEMQNWDLILMDFMLKEDSPTGDELISRIRKNQLYTEIIFYSEKKDEFIAALKEISSENVFLEGVFYADNREALPAKINSIIDLTLKKQQDINNIRGLVIAETIFLENKVENSLIKFFGVDDEKGMVFQKILDPHFGALDTKKKCDLLNKVCKIKKQTCDKQHQEIPKDNLEARKENQESIARLNLIHEELVKLNEEVIKIRNILAHTIESPDKKNELISTLGKTEEKIVINDDWCLITRRNLKKHSDNLDLLFNNL